MSWIVVSGYTKFTQVLPGLLMQVFQGNSQTREFWQFWPFSVFFVCKVLRVGQLLGNWVSSEYFLCVFVCKVFKGWCFFMEIWPS